MSLKVLFKYTTRSRRTNFLRGYDSIIKNLSDKDNYHVLITIDDNDSAMQPPPELAGNYTIVSGNSESKVHAINRDVNEFDYDWDILVNFSDDMTFTVKGFDDIIRDAVAKNGNNLDCVYHFPDQYQRQNCMTMSIIGRAYYDIEKFIYNNRFKSLWCDVVEQEKAMLSNKYLYVDKDIFIHIHPSLGMCKYDEQAIKTESYELRLHDYNIYLELKKQYDPNNILPIRNI